MTLLEFEEKYPKLSKIYSLAKYVSRRAFIKASPKSLLEVQIMFYDLGIFKDKACPVCAKLSVTDVYLEFSIYENKYFCRGCGYYERR